MVRRSHLNRAGRIHSQTGRIQPAQVVKQHCEPVEWRPR